MTTSSRWGARTAPAHRSIRAAGPRGVRACAGFQDFRFAARSGLLQGGFRASCPENARTPAIAVAGLDSLHLVKAHLALALFIELHSAGIQPSETTSTPQLHNMLKGLPSRAARCVYRFPFVGIRFRMFLESCLGQRSYQNRAYWNESLKGWASPYLGGTLSIDLRNSIPFFSRRLWHPTATSLLDLGCAGATLALCLGPEFKTYSGVDISDVAISKARENLAADKRHLATKYSLETGQVQDFQPSNNSTSLFLTKFFTIFPWIRCRR